MKEIKIFKISLLLSLALVVIKFCAWKMTHSDAIQASFIDSLKDSFTSITMIIAVIIIHTPPSNRFQFGFHKVENLVIFLESSIITFSGIFGIYESVKHLLYPTSIENSEYGIFIIGISIILISLYLIFLKKLSLDGDLLKSHFYHYQSDLVSNLMIFINLIFYDLFNIYWLDSIVGIVYFFLILKRTSRICIKSFFIMIDASVDTEILMKIRSSLVNIVSKYNNIKINNVRTRYTGSRINIEITLIVPSNIDLNKVLKAQLEIKESIINKIQNSDIVISIVGTGGLEPPTTGL